MIHSLNVVLLPSPEVQEAAIRLSQEIAQSHPHHFVLDGVTCYAHMTIFKAKMAEGNIFHLYEAVGNIARGCAPFLCQDREIKTGRGYILRGFERSGPLYDLHEAVVTAVDPLRSPETRKPTPWMNAAERNSLRLYGHPRVLGTWEPHMTIIRLKKEGPQPPALPAQDAWPSLSFLANTIAVVQEGEHGTCRQILQRYDFAGAVPTETPA